MIDFDIDGSIEDFLSQLNSDIESFNMDIYGSIVEKDQTIVDEE